MDVDRHLPVDGACQSGRVMGAGTEGTYALDGVDLGVERVQTFIVLLLHRWRTDPAALQGDLEGLLWLESTWR